MGKLELFFYGIQASNSPHGWLGLVICLGANNSVVVELNGMITIVLTVVDLMDPKECWLTIGCDGVSIEVQFFFNNDEY